jgi:hypothetical protein
MPVVRQGSRLKVRRKGKPESSFLGDAGDLLQVLVDRFLELGNTRKSAQDALAPCFVITRP